MNKSYKVSKEKASEVFKIIATRTNKGGYGGIYTEDRNGVSSNIVSAVYNDRELHINSILPQSKIENKFDL